MVPETLIALCDLVRLHACSFSDKVDDVNIGGGAVNGKDIVARI
jgi:hypothetical protein